MLQLQQQQLRLLLNYSIIDIVITAITTGSSSSSVHLLTVCAHFSLSLRIHILIFIETIECESSSSSNSSARRNERLCCYRLFASHTNVYWHKLPRILACELPSYMSLIHTHDSVNIPTYYSDTHSLALRFQFHQCFASLTTMCIFSLSFSLARFLIAVSKAKILGNEEMFIKSGNDINLTCTTSQVSNPPSFIYWYKGGRVINYSQRGGINVSTDRTTKTSNLIISRATPSDR